MKSLLLIAALVALVIFLVMPRPAPKGVEAGHKPTCGACAILRDRHPTYLPILAVSAAKFEFFAD